MLGTRVCMVCALLLPATTVRADPFHRQPVPLGERALGMGGAFTGLANDPSAAFYNPGGLAQIEDSALSASLTLNAFDRLSIERGYRTALGAEDLTHRAQPTLPLFVSLVKQVGRRDAEGRTRHALALSTFTVEQRRLEFDASLAGQDPVSSLPVYEDFLVQDERAEVWHGLSYSFRINDRLSVGASGFLSLAESKHREERTVITLGMPSSDGAGYENPTATLENRVAEASVKNLVARVGVLWAPRDELSLGLTFQPPSIELSGTARVKERIFFSTTYFDEATQTDKSYATYYDDDQKKLGSSAPSPWELRLGAAYLPGAGVLLTLDGSVAGAVGSRRHPIVAYGARTPDPDTGRTSSAGDLALESWYARPVANAALGVEARIREAVVVRAGLFTDLSAAPAVRKSMSTYAPPDIDRFGGTFSLGLIAGGYDLSIGAAGLLGQGKALAYVADGSASDVFVRTDASERTVFVFFSGAKRAVTRLAKAALRKVRELRRDEPDEATP